MKKTNCRTRRFLATYIDFAMSILPMSLLIELIEKIFSIDIDKNIFMGITTTLIYFSIIVYTTIKKDTLLKNQYRSLGKIITGLYIVDIEGNIINDKKLLEKKNKMSLSNPLFYIYRVLLFDESEAEAELGIYVVPKKDIAPLLHLPRKDK